MPSIMNHRQNTTFLIAQYFDKIIALSYVFELIRKIDLMQAGIHFSGDERFF